MADAAIPLTRAACAIFPCSTTIAKYRKEVKSTFFTPDPLFSQIRGFTPLWPTSPLNIAVGPDSARSSEIYERRRRAGLLQATIPPRFMLQSNVTASERV